MIISCKTFLTYIEAIAAEEPSYRLGGYGSDGTCDCIGLIIGAIRRAGGSWRGIHGSNYAARSEVEDLLPITTASQLQVGEAVFKAREPGDANYSLPARYDSSPDRRDYCHVGVVVSVDPLRIRHMTSPKPKMDTKLGKWRYHGWLMKIDRGEKPMGSKVSISGGNLNLPVNMRSGPGRDYKIVAEIPQNSEGEMIEYSPDGGWAKVQISGRTGWIQQQFVHTETAPVTSTPVTTPVVSDDSTVTIPRADLEKVYDTIGDWLGLRG